MKKQLCFIVLAYLIVSISVAGCAQKQKGDEPITGGYTEDREVTADDLSVFEEATAELDGVSYEPTLVATQVVAGTNYRFTATATPITPDAESYAVYVYVFVPLDGAPELTEIIKL